MIYPIAIEVGDDNRAFGVAVPDLPGCFSSGDTMDEAIANAEDAILLYLEDSFAAGKAPPMPTPLNELRALAEYEGWVWALVNVDLGKLNTRAQRVNITIPESVLDTIDSYVKRRGENRSSFLTRAALEVMSRDAA